MGGLVLPFCFFALFAYLLFFCFFAFMSVPLDPMIDAFNACGRQ